MELDNASLEKNISDIFSDEEFNVYISSKVSDLYTIKELIEIFGNYDRGKEKEWFDNIDSIFLRLEEVEENREYLLKIRSTRENLRVQFLILGTFPIFVEFCKTLIIFVLEVIKYGNFERIKDFAESVKENKIYKKLFLQIQSICTSLTFLTIFLNLKNISNGEKINLLNWDSYCKYLDEKMSEDKKFDQTMLKCNKQIFDEYNDYLRENINLEGTYCNIM